MNRGEKKQKTELSLAHISNQNIFSTCARWGVRLLRQQSLFSQTIKTSSTSIWLWVLSVCGHAVNSRGAHRLAVCCHCADQYFIKTCSLIVFHHHGLALLQSVWLLCVPCVRWDNWTLFWARRNLLKNDTCGEMASDVQVKPFLPLIWKTAARAAMGRFRLQMMRFIHLWQGF